MLFAYFLLKVNLCSDGIIWYVMSPNDKFFGGATCSVSLKDAKFVGGFVSVVCWPLWHFRKAFRNDGSPIPVCNCRFISNVFF